MSELPLLFLFTNFDSQWNYLHIEYFSLKLDVWTPSGDDQFLLFAVVLVSLV